MLLSNTMSSSFTQLPVFHSNVHLQNAYLTERNFRTKLTVYSKKQVAKAALTSLVLLRKFEMDSYTSITESISYV